MKPVLPRLAALTLACLAGALTPAFAQGASQDPEMACMQRCPLVPDSFGTKKADPACIKKCLLTGGAPDPAPPASAAIRFTPAWEASATRRQQKTTLEAVVRRLPQGTAASAPLVAAVKQWMLANVIFHRTSRPAFDGNAPELRATRGQLEIDDRFFAIGDAKQENLLMFELGKVLWIRTDPSQSGAPSFPPEVRAAAARVTALTGMHSGLLYDLKRAAHKDDSLGSLIDGADTASTWGYALRAIMLGLEPATAERRAEWARVRPEFERAFAILVR